RNSHFPVIMHHVVADVEMVGEGCDLRLAQSIDHRADAVRPLLHRLTVVEESVAENPDVRSTKHSRQPAKVYPLHLVIDGTEIVAVVPEQVIVDDQVTSAGRQVLAAVIVIR